MARNPEGRIVEATPIRKPSRQSIAPGDARTHPPQQGPPGTVERGPGPPAPGHSWVMMRETAFQVPTEHLQNYMGAGPRQFHQPRWDERNALLAVGGILLPVLLLLSFNAGWNFIDRPDPDMGGARIWYGLTALAGLAASFAVIAIDSNRAAGRLGVAAAIALPCGMWFSSLMEGLYGEGTATLFLFFGGWIFMMPMFLLWLATLITTLAVGNSRGGTRGADFAVGGGFGLALAFAGAAAYHLSTLDRQAELAIEAHKSPGLGFVIAAVVLLGLAIVHRRRKR